MRYLKKDILIFSFFISLIIFFFFDISYNMIFMGEISSQKGHGFPFVWHMTEISESMGTTISIPYLLLDFFIYYIIVSISIIIILSISKMKVIKITEHKTLTLILILLASFCLILYITRFWNIIFSTIDYQPIYSSIKVKIWSF